MFSVGLQTSKQERYKLNKDDDPTSNPGSLPFKVGKKREVLDKGKEGRGLRCQVTLALRHINMAVLGVPVTLFLWPFAVILVVVLILKIAVGATVKSSWYKSTFAAYQDRWIIHSKEILHQCKLELFAYLSEGLKEVSGDVLEIGVGPGANFDYYPQGTSLIAVDENPHVEKHFRQNLERSGKRVHLKAFVVACAEDMSSKGQVGVADGSVAAVVFTKLLCSLSEDNIRKILREVKRVLKPVCLVYYCSVA